MCSVMCMLQEGRCVLSDFCDLIEKLEDKLDCSYG